MKQLILFSLLTLPATCFAQKFYVEKADKGAEQVIINSLLDHKYAVTFNSDSADYIIRPNIRTRTMGRAQGNVLIINSKTGDIVSSTENAKGAANLTNGYDNPVAAALRKICKRSLIDSLEKLINKSATTKG